MNDKSHWNKIAPTYNDEIFDVYASDRNKRLPYYIKKYSDRTKTVLDVGCGNGKSFQHLAPQFKQVIGIDISRGLLSQARARGYPNIILKQADVTRKLLRLPTVDVAFCCNVIMFADLRKNHQAFQNVNRALISGGTALFVVPSLDSALFSSWRLIDLYRREGVRPAEIPAHEFHYFKGTKRDLIQGIVHIDGVPTKHYSESELRVILPEAGFTITTLTRIEYEWDTELASAPGWLKAPYPWDWLVVCTKN